MLKLFRRLRSLINDGRKEVKPMLGKKLGGPTVVREQVEKQILADYPSLYRLAFTYVKNQDDAMDVVQESVCKAISNADCVRSTDAIKAWLCQIVVNTALNMLHSQKREVSIDALPDDGKEDAYQDADLLRSLDILSEEERTVVVLRFFEELKLQEIAEQTDRNVNTVKTLLYRSLKKLRAHLTKGDHEYGTEMDRRAQAGI